MKIFFNSLIAVITFSNAVIAQNDTLHAKLDSLQKQSNQDGQTNIISPKAYTESTRISFPAYFILLGSDFKQDITAPFHLTKKQFLQTSIYIGSIAALQSLSENFDEPIQRFAAKSYTESNVVSSASDYITKFGGRYELYTLAALGGYGFMFDNKKMQTTTLLATQAYLTSGLIETGIKYLSGRQRPSYYNPNHTEAEPIFHGPGFDGNRHINSSFPSGHTTVIFAAATVFAKEYKTIPLVPVVAYSAATLVGLSRLTENKHWATDIIVGATLGYLCGNQVVNNYHRYAKLRAPLKSGTVSFNLNYNGYNFEPGLVYTFK